jgi:ADP-heptose:LPS heptosyltransferase
LRAGTADIHVLLIRLSALGDVVHTLPAASFLQENLPDAKLTWIVEPPFVDLLENNPAVDDVIVFPKKKISAELSNPMRWLSPTSEFRQFVALLKERKFTAAIDFQGLFKSGAIAFLSGAATRVGFAQARELSPLFMTHKCDTGDYFANDKHVVLHNLELAEFYLRIAGGAREKSRIIHFPLPDPGADSFSQVLKLIGFDQVPQSENADTSTLSSLESKRNHPTAEQSMQPLAGSDGVVAPVESDAVSGASLSGHSGGSGGVAGADGSTAVERPVQSSSEASDVISQPPAGSASGMISTPPVKPPAGTASLASNQSAETGDTPVKTPKMQDWSAASGSTIGAGEMPYADEAISLRKSAGQKLVVLIPGTTWVTKIWPEEKWAQLVSQLVQVPNVQIVLVGGPSEAKMNSYIYDSVSSTVADRRQVMDITGKTSIRALVALFMMADIVVGADTGPLHMACAVNVPRVIGVHGSTPWGRNGPLGIKSSVVALNLSCQPCFEKQCPLGTLACLKDLEVDAVLSEVKRALHQG